MFNRRPRNYFQVGFIILLLLGVAYLIYLNNIAQVKITTLEAKSQRYHSQQQSLSSQLQGDYESVILMLVQVWLLILIIFIKQRIADH